MRISQRRVDFKRPGGYPLAVLPVATVLCNLADVDFGVEIRGESLSVVPGIAVHDIQGLHLREIMLGRVGGEYARHSRVETASENRRQARFLEAFAVGPLP